MAIINKKIMNIECQTNKQNKQTITYIKTRNRIINKSIYKIFWHIKVKKRVINIKYKLNKNHENSRNKIYNNYFKDVILYMKNNKLQTNKIKIP